MKAVKHLCLDDDSKMKAGELRNQFEMMVKELETLPLKDLCAKGTGPANAILKDVGAKIGRYSNELTKMTS
jgi:hypothetical protein